MKPKLAINITAEEKEVLFNHSFYLHKHALTQKLYKLFSQIIELQKKNRQFMEFNFPGEVDIEQGRISKGENLQKLPYVILDFPRHFSNNGIFAFRTLCWFGKYFSVTFHLSGNFMDKYRQCISANLHLLRKREIRINMQKEWDHEITGQSFIPLLDIHEIALKTEIRKTGFMKFSKILALDQIDHLPAFYESFVTELLNILEEK